MAWVPTQEHDASEALMQERGSGLEVPMQEHDSSVALMVERKRVRTPLAQGVSAQSCLELQSKG